MRLTDPENNLSVDLSLDEDGFPIVKIIPSPDDCYMELDDGTIYPTVEVWFDDKLIRPMFPEEDN